jgi:hypothetical protein
VCSNVLERVTWRSLEELSASLSKEGPELPRAVKHRETCTHSPLLEVAIYRAGSRRATGVRFVNGL